MDTFANAFPKFRGKEQKEKWKTAKGFVCPMTASSLVKDEDITPQFTTSDTPYVDGYKAMGVAHYRTRAFHKETVNMEFKRFGKDKDAWEAKTGTDKQGSLRRNQHINAASTVKHLDKEEKHS